MDRWLFYYSDTPGRGLTGGGRSIKSLVLGLNERGIDPLFVTPREGAVAQELRKRGVAVRLVPLPGPLDVYDKKVLRYGTLRKVRAGVALLQYNSAIHDLAEEENIDGMWARGIRSMLQVGLASWWGRRPLVWDIGVENRPEGLIWGLHALGLALADRVVTQAKRQPRIVFGRALTTAFRNQFQPIYPGIDSRRGNALREAAKNRSDGRTQIVNIGSVHPRKNQKMSLEAFTYVAEKHPDAILNIVGEVKHEDYLSDLQEFVDARGIGERVHFLGWCDDVPALLGDSTVLLLSSRREGVPHVIREAMFAELPVVATAVGGVPEAVVDGETGFLVPEDDAEQMGQRISALLSSPTQRNRMGEKALRFARRRFSQNAWLESYANLLRNVRPTGTDRRIG